ncbi:hypothetical protein ACFOWE_18550 [Planomonospora corallina]|uniref:Secreted protein n=1 Tax=Planomonospora corallina TaxID=1806052 RepID=A0ABV8IB55_9ACTN
MRRRSSVLAALAAAAVLAAPAAAAAGTSGQASETGGRTLSFRGMTLRLPSGWRVHDHRDRVLVTTGKCRTPEPFAPDCRGFWLYGPEVIAYGAGGRRYTGSKPFVPASGAPVGCPFAYGSVQVLGRAGDRGLHRVGRGHTAKYVAWDGRCVKRDGRTTALFTQREWFLPTSKIVVVDAWKTPGLTKVLRNATWSRRGAS